MTSFHERLRLATRDCHDKLDHHPLLVGLMRRDVSQTHYGQVLQRLAGVQHALEQQTALLAEDAPFMLSSRLNAIEADLSELHLMPLPVRITLPIADSMAQRIGIRYVLKGSMLGSQMIFRHLTQLDINIPCRFFSCLGIDVAYQWQHFLTLATQACPLNQQSIAIESAVQTFGFIQQHLNDDI